MAEVRRDGTRRSLRLAGVLVSAAVLCSGCVTTLYAHKTLDGAYLPLQGLAHLRPGLSPEEVEGLVGKPVAAITVAGVETWRYYERAEPRWCDGGNSWLERPQYSVELILTFADTGLASAELKTTGAVEQPVLDPRLANRAGGTD